MPLHKQELRNPLTEESTGSDDLSFVPPPGAGIMDPQAPSRQFGRRRRSVQEEIVGDNDEETQDDEELAESPHQAGTLQREKRRLPTQAKRRVTSRTSVRDEPVLPEDMTWGQQFAVEVSLFGMACAVWGINAYLTIGGLQALGWPTSLTGNLGGFLVHIGISWGERYLPKQRSVWLQMFGWGLRGVDVGSTIYGIVPRLDAWFPWLLGTMPRSPWMIWTALEGAWNTRIFPGWFALMFILIVLAGIVALKSELWMHSYWQRLKRTWHLRPMMS